MPAWWAYTMPRVPTAAALGLVLSVAGSACARYQSGIDDLPVAEFTGHFTVSDRSSWFVPCAASDSTPASHWVTLVGDAVGQVRAARAAGQLTDGEPSVVRWWASVTDERHAGPGGPALLVRRVVEIRPASAADCRNDPTAAEPAPQPAR